MSTEVRSAIEPETFSLSISGEPSLVTVRLRTPSTPGITLPREDFLAAVAKELNVRIVPIDAIVVERSELPEVTYDPDAVFPYRVNDNSWSATYDPRPDALERLAVSVYLKENPPVDESQRRSLKAALGKVGVNDGKRLDDVVAELMAAGVRIEVRDV